MDKNNNTLSEVRKTAAQRMWDAENKQRAKSDASNKRTPSSIPVPDKKMKTEGATGAKPGWMLRQDPVLGSRVKAAQAKQKEFKKLVGTKVPVKPTPTQGVAESGIPHSNTFGIKSRGINLKSFAKKDTLVATLHSSKEKEANEFAKKHNYIVKKHAYVDPYSKEEKHTFQVHKESVTEAKDPREYDYEGDMAKSQLRSIIANAQRAHDMLEDDTNMAEWVQSKITLAADYISTVADYMQSQVNEEAIIEAHTEYDIANGGTVIYKHDGKHYMAKVSHKTGGGAGTMIHTTSSPGHKIKLNQVVSTDASDWTKFKNIKEETEQGVVEAHIVSPLSAANANAEYKRQPSNTLKVDVKHLGGVSNHKAVKQHLISKGITAGIGSSDNYNTVHLSNISHSHGEIKKKLGIKEEAKKGLYYNVNKRKKAVTSRSKNHPDAPSAQDWKDAAKTAKEEVELSELNKDTVISYAIRAHKDQDKQFTAIGKGIRNNDPKSANKASHKFSKRAAGLDRVETRLNKESKSFLDIRKELDERNLTPVEKIAREELSKMKYKKVRGAPTE